MDDSAYEKMLRVALEEARMGLIEGGIPIGAALFTRDGELVSRGHNRRVQQGDPSMHGETDAFRRAGRQKSYRLMSRTSRIGTRGLSPSPCIGQRHTLP